MIEKLKNGGLVWHKNGPNQFTTSAQQDGYQWTMYLTKQPTTSLITLDFRRNNKFFYSINSDDDADLVDLYNEIDTDEDLQKDTNLLFDIQQFEGAGPKTSNEFMHGGIRCGGAAG